MKIFRLGRRDTFGARASIFGAGGSDFRPGDSAESAQKDALYPQELNVFLTIPSA
jgi:hypothetical protein